MPEHDVGTEELLGLLREPSLDPGSVVEKMNGATVDDVARARTLLRQLDGAPPEISQRIAALPDPLGLAVARAAGVAGLTDLLRELALAARSPVAEEARRELRRAPPTQLEGSGVLTAMRSAVAPSAGVRYRSLEHFAWKNPGRVTLALVGACVVVAAFTLPGDAAWRSERLYAFGAKVNDEIADGAWWRLVTCAFLHGNWEHLLFNCYALFVVGSFVEKAYGRVRLLAFFVLAAMGGSLASYLLVESPSVGASGAIFGLMGAGMLASWRGDSETVVALGPKQLVLLGVWAGQSLVEGFVPGSGIDNAAHIGGLATGLVAAGLIREGRLARVVAAGGAAVVLVSASLGARFAPKVFAFVRGAQAFRADDLEGAERELVAADDIPRALVLRAGIRLKRHEFAAALALAERAALARPSDVRMRAHGLRALALVSLDRYPEAILAAEEAMKSEDAEIRNSARELRDKIRQRQSQR